MGWDATLEVTLVGDTRQFLYTLRNVIIQSRSEEWQQRLPAARKYFEEACAGKISQLLQDLHIGNLTLQGFVLEGYNYNLFSKKEEIANEQSTIATIMNLFSTEEVLDYQDNYFNLIIVEALLTVLAGEKYLRVLGREEEYGFVNMTVTAKETHVIIAHTSSHKCRDDLQIDYRGIADLIAVYPFMKVVSRISVE